ncbi:hypothetical protein BJ508DRAFT_333653 [Ascobolus immersus RN42]|uniref:Uncharacterized protein n=1 Tax=Ascobolus immersus RN42 TaxID=1160509 RepID=A0A3N4HW47_ASCIM|nr:hypothetical protein BJ508DRAFT_333653 [Ascobolus immersus RN42]
MSGNNKRPLSTIWSEGSETDASESRRDSVSSTGSVIRWVPESERGGRENPIAHDLEVKTSEDNVKEAIAKFPEPPPRPVVARPISASDFPPPPPETPPPTVPKSLLVASQASVAARPLSSRSETDIESPAPSPSRFPSPPEYTELPDTSVKKNGAK